MAGQRQTMVDGNGATTWAYDAAGRVNEVTDAFGQGVGYSYNGQGQRTGLEFFFEQLAVFAR